MHDFFSSWETILFFSSIVNVIFLSAVCTVWSSDGEVKADLLRERCDRRPVVTEREQRAAPTRSCSLEVFMPKHTSFLLEGGTEGVSSGGGFGEEGWKPKTKHSMMGCKHFHVSGGVTLARSTCLRPAKATVKVARCRPAGLCPRVLLLLMVMMMRMMMLMMGIMKNKP